MNTQNGTEGQTRALLHTDLTPIPLKWGINVEDARRQREHEERCARYETVAFYSEEG